MRGVSGNTKIVENRRGQKMDRKHLLAAELHNYSFENYRNHPGIGNKRFDDLMPHDAMLLERAESENWPDERIASELEIEHGSVLEWRQKFMRAKSIVDASDPARSFRNGIRFSIQDAVEKGFANSKDIEDLVVQICYRASDISVLLELREESLSKYSDALRQKS
jgi:hypothetical protein